MQFSHHFCDFLSPVGPDILLSYPLQKDWGIFRRVRKIDLKRILGASCLPIRMEQLGSHWTDFHEILYLIFFCWKSVLKVQI